MYVSMKLEGLMQKSDIPPANTHQPAMQSGETAELAKSIVLACLLGANISGGYRRLLPRIFVKLN
jgi:hypothetical protein